MSQNHALREDIADISEGRSSLAAPLVAVIVLIAAALVSYSTIQPPVEIPANAPASEFSAIRAAQHLTEIVQKPRPIGSLEHQRVRDYILGKLTALGLNPQARKTTVVKPLANGSFSSASVRNILARIDGTQNDRSVLLMAHYDSVHTSIGASDNGVAVATLLETASALKAGPRLKNGIILLFTDAEEVGLLGAKAFVEEDAMAKDVDAVCNFDARGTSGVAIMFETSSQNGRLIDEFAKAVPSPVAFSLAYEVYKFLPNDSDFSVFKQAGLRGLNFAFVGGFDKYHTMLDDLQNADRRSLQHQGSYALAIARRFGNLSIGADRESDQIYFSTLGATLIHYSKSFALALALAEVLLFLFLTASGVRKKQVSIRAILIGLFAFMASLAICSGTVGLIYWSMKALHGQYRSFPNGVPYKSGLYFVAFQALTLAILSAVYLLFGKRLNKHNLNLGVLLGWLILTLVTTFVVPGASYLFACPLLFSLVSTGFLLRSAEPRSAPLAQAAIVSVLTIPAILLFVPTIYLLFVTMALEASWVAAGLEVLLLGLLIPHLNLFASPRRWLLPAAAVASAVVLIAMASLRSGFDRNHPKVNSIFYALNAESGKAVWASYDQRPDEWTSQFLGPDATRGGLAEYLPTRSTEFLRRETTAFPLEPPIITLLSDTARSGGRTLHLRLTSQRMSEVISAFITSCSGTVARVNDKPLNASLDAGLGIRHYGPGDEGFDLVLELNSSAPIKITAVDMKYQLPEVQGMTYRKRYEYMMPSYLPFSDATIVSKPYNF